MDDNERCCGTGHCMINAQGVCWCGQQWDGVKMCLPAAAAVTAGGDSSLQGTDALTEKPADD